MCRGVALITAGLLACCGAIGCGSDDSSPSGGKATVSIPGKLGTAKIEGTPKRVVALDLTSADAALAVGVTPVGIGKVSYTKDGLLPWTRTALRRSGSKPKLLNSDEISVEDVAKLEPDVILATGVSGVAKVDDQLRHLAPVVSYRGGEVTDTWQDSAIRVGRALGREGAARAKVREATTRLDRTARRSGLRGKTISLFNFVRVPYLVKEPDDASVRFFASLGMTPPPAAKRLPQAPGGRTEVSLERLDVLDADVVLGTSPAPASLEAFARRSVFRQVPAVRKGHYDRLDLEAAVAIAFPSVLSVPWALDHVVPRIRRAAAA